MALPTRAQRVLRSIRQAVPAGVVLGRRSTGVGPVEFIGLDEITTAQLDAISAVHGSILYRNATEWVGLAPGTSGHFLKTNGAAANPEWAAAAGGGGGATELDYDPPTLTDLSINRQTAVAFTASASDVAGKGLLLFLNPTGGGDKTIARLKAPPATPYTITVRLRQTPHDTASEAGIMLYNSSNGRNLRVLQLGSGQVFFQQWTNLEAFNATITTSSYAGNGVFLHIWLRLTVDGSGNVEAFWSFDGAYFKPVGTTTLAAFLTAAGGSADEVGVHARANASGGLGSACFQYYNEA